MKTVRLSMCLLVLTTTPLLAEDHPSKATIEAANKEVSGAQKEVHQARQNYMNAVRTSGKESPQALSAKTRLDTARAHWRGTLSTRQDLRHQARRDMYKGK